MSKIVKLEALVGWPPTGKCRETLDVLEEIVRRHPEEAQRVGCLARQAVLFHKGAAQKHAEAVCSLLKEHG